jgi:predicted RNA-binding Zn-ribbon protein involved in translation (DUF1610 family)
MITKTTTQRIYLNNNDEASITCPNCGKSKIKNLSNYKIFHTPIKVKCSCGHIFKIIIESRRYYRKNTNIPGRFKGKEPGNAGSIVIENLSLSGIGFKTRFKNNIQVGEILEVSFTLDNEAKSEIIKTVRVKRVQDNFIGAEFCDLKDFGKELGYYLKPG